jgi:hypothetical protein
MKAYGGVDVKIHIFLTVHALDRSATVIGLMIQVEEKYCVIFQLNLEQAHRRYLLARLKFIYIRYSEEVV